MNGVPSDLTQLFQFLGAGGNLALVICVYYIIQWTKGLAEQTTQMQRLADALNLLLARMGYQLQPNGDIVPLPKGSGQ